jgi:hypothetical protein
MSEQNSDDPAIHFADYDAFVDRVRYWLGTRASRFHSYYTFSRIALVAFGVSVPALSAGLFGDRGKLAAPFVALLIALLAALDALLKPNKRTLRNVISMFDPVTLNYSYVLS